MSNTIIHSDCWKSYERIKQLDKNFLHRTVNHDLYFVDPTTRVHTNGVESSWNACKTPLKQMRGISRNYLQSYLDEHCWRQLFKDEFQVFERMLSEIANQFPPGSIDYILDDIASLTIDDFTKVCGLFDVIDLNDKNEEVLHLPDYAEEELNVIALNLRMLCITLSVQKWKS